MKPLLKSNKGTVTAESAASILDILLFLVILGAAAIIASQQDPSDLRAEDRARDIANYIDALSLSANDMKIKASCPSSTKLLFDDYSVTAIYNAGFGKGEATAYFVKEEGVSLTYPDNGIECDKNLVVFEKKTTVSASNAIARTIDIGVRNAE